VAALTVSPSRAASPLYMHHSVAILRFFADIFRISHSTHHVKNLKIFVSFQENLANHPLLDVE
jgi:hypothetical protein